MFSKKTGQKMTEKVLKLLSVFLIETLIMVQHPNEVNMIDWFSYIPFADSAIWIPFWIAVGYIAAYIWDNSTGRF